MKLKVNISCESEDYKYILHNVDMYNNSRVDLVGTIVKVNNYLKAINENSPETDLSAIEFNLRDLDRRIGEYEWLIEANQNEKDKALEIITNTATNSVQLNSARQYINVCNMAKITYVSALNKLKAERVQLQAEREKINLDGIKAERERLTKMVQQMTNNLNQNIDRLVKKYNAPLTKVDVQPIYDEYKRLYAFGVPTLDPIDAIICDHNSTNYSNTNISMEKE